MSKALLAVLLLLSSALPAAAQCVAGDILWVAETVNADVGLAAGAGRCATDTVAGAACNSTGSPFGIQAALDCAVLGVTIRVLAGANNYDSGSTSWNNRFDATKELRVPNTGAATNPVRLEGWVDTGTQCNTLQDTDCPVVLDFATGTNDGITVIDSLSGRGWFYQGLRITNAAVDGVDMANANPFGAAEMEVDNNGGEGFDCSPCSHNFFFNIYAHDNGVEGMSSGVDSAVNFFEGHDNVDGFSLSGIQTSLERALLYDNSDQGLFLSSPEQSQLLFTTIVDSADDGYGQSTGPAIFAGSFANIYQNNGGFGMDNYTNITTGRMTAWTFNLTCGNTLGTYDPIAPGEAEILLGNVDGVDEAFFTGPPNTYTAVGFDELSMLMPRGTSDFEFCQGCCNQSCNKASSCGGPTPGGFMQGARRLRLGRSLRDD